MSDNGTGFFSWGFEFYVFNQNPHFLHSLYIMQIIVLLIISFFSSIIVNAEENNERFRKILQISIQYNELVLYTLRHNNNNEVIIKKLINSYNQAVRQSWELKEGIGHKSPLEESRECLQLMSRYRKKNLVLISDIRRKLYELDLGFASVPVIKHDFSNCELKSEDTKNQMMFTMSEMKKNLAHSIDILRKMTDRESCYNFQEPLQDTLKQHNEYSDILYIYAQDDPETGKAIIEEAQSMYLKLYPEIEKEVDRLFQNDFFGLDNLKILLIPN